VHALRPTPSVDVVRGLGDFSLARLFAQLWDSEGDKRMVWDSQGTSGYIDLLEENTP
jgi:hypothetical protein